MFRANLRRLLAIDDPPERTALAFSIGVFIAFFPLLGLHAILATVIAFAFRFNKLAIYTGTFVNNPFLTLVPIILVSYGLGAMVIGRTLAGVMAQEQTKPTSSPTPVPQRPSTQQAGQQPRQSVLDLSEVGVQIKPEPRLIVVMAALDAAGFDPTPAGEAPSNFRMQLH